MILKYPDFPQAILESMNEPVYIRDMDKNLLYINRASEKMTRWKRDEISGRKCYVVFGDEGHRCCRDCPADRLFQENSPDRHGERVILTRKGERRRVRSSVSPLGGKEAFAGAIVILEDITNLRSLEQDNRTTRDRLENTLEEARISRNHLLEAQRIASLGSWSWNITDNTSQCSEEYFSLFGLPYRTSGFPHEEFLSFIHPDEREPVNRAMKDLVREGGTYDQTYRVILPDGSERLHHARAIVKYDKKGKASHVVGIQHDITEQYLIRKALKKSETRYSRAVEAVSDGIWEWQPGKDELFLSPKCYTMLSYEVKETPLNLASCLELVHPEDRKKTYGIITGSMKSGEPFETEFRVKTEEGRWKWVLTRGKTVEWDSEGRASRLVGTHGDIDRRKEAEEEILKQKQLADRYLNMSEVVFIGMDPSGKITLVNDYACRILECGREDLIGRNWFAEFLPDDCREEVSSVFTRFIRREIELPESFENRIQTRTGNIRNIVWYNTYITNNQGDITSLLCSGEDITEKKELEDRYRSIIQTSLDGFVRMDLKGRILEVNQAYCRMVGYGEEELLTMGIENVERGDTPEEEAERLRKLLETGHVQFETVQRKKDGSRVDLEVIIQLRRGEKEFVSFIKDITTRKQQEMDLKFQALLLDQIQDHIVATDLEGNITYVNETECRTLDYKQEELVGRSVNIYGEAQIGGASQREILSQVLEKGQWEGEVVSYTSKGEEITLFCRTRLVRDDRGTPFSLVAIATDVTEKKRMAERMEESQKLEAIGSLAGGIAHDFNNILTPITGMAELLMEDLVPGSDGYFKVRDILKAGKRAAHLVQQILAFSRKSVHQAQTVRLQQVIEEVGKLIQATVPAGVDIVQSIDLLCGPVRIDPNQFHQVVLNIITNASHAVEAAGGEIRILLEERLLEGAELPEPSMTPGRYAHLCISDNGEGIPREVIGKIFEPYFTTKPLGKGTGLGLAVVYGIIKEHHGEILVESDEGRGTAFHIYLSIVEDVTLPAVKSSDPLPLGYERILIVDDDSAVLKLEELILTRLGYRVTPCGSSHAALDTYRKDPHGVDLVITDMAMPRMTGEELAGKLKSIRPELPVLICTGYNERMDEDMIRELGLDGLIRKPIGTADLAAAVRAVLDGENESLKELA